MLYGMSPTNVFMRTIKLMRLPLGRHLFSLKITQGFLPSSKSTTPPISFTATQILLQGEVCRSIRVANSALSCPISGGRQCFARCEHGIKECIASSVAAVVFGDVGCNRQEVSACVARQCLSRHERHPRTPRSSSGHGSSLDAAAEFQVQGRVI
jgi:hypothetical protein